MVDNPVKVTPSRISSEDITKFDGGLFLNGVQSAPKNTFVSGSNVTTNKNGFLEPRRGLSFFLPDTVETTYQKFPVLWSGNLYYFVADNGKIRFCQEGDSDWTDCSGTDNSFTTNAGGVCTFIRALDAVLILNGGNGDGLAYVDLATAGFPVVKYTAVTNPTTAPTSTLTGLSAGSFSIYYAYSYSGKVGETELSSIATISINHSRDEWPTLTTPGTIKLSRPAGSPPAGAQYWNLYIALASTGGTIQPSDMLRLASKLDLANHDFLDNGALAIDLGSVPPLANSTAGPKVTHGITANGTPILWGDQDDPYNIWIGGAGPYALDFSISNGGYRAEPEKGSNYYPSAIIGFRTGQGAPALTVLYSNTEGLSKQAVLEQQTVTYGDRSFTVWGVTEQHYGAAGVAAPNSAINYNGKLMFLSTDGFLSMQTQPTVQNVISMKPISTPIDSYVRSIKVSAMDKVVGAGWNNKYMWIVPNDGFDTPQQILILDTNNPGVAGDGAWHTIDVPADWIGVVSPQESAAFVYICQGNKTYKLLDVTGTYDVKNGINVPFATSVTSPFVPLGGEAHNGWQACIQAVFYLVGLVGTITLGVRFRNQSGSKNGTTKVKTKVYQGPVFVPSTVGGWGDPHYTYSAFPQIAGYVGGAPIDAADGQLTSVDVRVAVPIDDIVNEAQWFLETDAGYNDYQLRAVSYEGVNLGIRPDLS